ncbi:hypothetical protein D039_0712, partial [Vibrio parahaemolyticus EKP-028]
MNASRKNQQTQKPGHILCECACAVRGSA